MHVSVHAFIPVSLVGMKGLIKTLHKIPSLFSSLEDVALLPPFLALPTCSPHSLSRDLPCYLGALVSTPLGMKPGPLYFLPPTSAPQLLSLPLANRLWGIYPLLWLLLTIPPIDISRKDTTKAVVS